MRRLHVLTLPHSQVNAEHVSCAYTAKVWKFCRMMAAAGEAVSLYAGEHSAEIDGVENVVVFTDEDQAEWFPGLSPTDMAPPKMFQEPGPWWTIPGGRTIAEIGQRIGPKDLILPIGGIRQQLIAEAFPDHISAEWGVGYEGIFSDYVCFESYAWLHHIYGLREWRHGRWYDDVIPNAVDPAEFRPSTYKGKSTYALFLGRVIQSKGPHVAGMIAERVGLPLKIAGVGAREEDGKVIGEQVEIPGAEYLGPVGIEERAELLRHATVLIAPTQYVEPFGGVAVEAMMSGCPVVATDWGAFTETVETGRTGYRFRTLAEGEEAVLDAMGLSRTAIRRRAIERYSLDACTEKYLRWFGRLDGLYGGPGWGA